MSTKTCFKCSKTKPLSEFYKHSAMADGHLGKCKECTKTDVKGNYGVRRRKYAAYERTREQTPERKAKKRIYQKRHRAKHPDRDAARQAVNRGVRNKTVKKLPCCYCGNPKSQAHHHDYSKPLDVRWVCFKCHREKEHDQTTTPIELCA